MNDEMLKQVGAAILEAESTWTPKSPIPKERAMALAALNAMREPPEGIMRAAFATGVETDNWLDFIRGYRRVIDVALGRP